MENSNLTRAYFAGGCFWCVEHDLREAPGVSEVYSGYIGDEERNATYEMVASHMTKHREAVEVLYDPSTTNFRKLCQFFIDHIDPTDDGGQFGDRGENYKATIYYANDEEKRIAQETLKELDDSHVYDNPSRVELLPLMPFYKAEEYHQRYAEKNPLAYGMYRSGSGREDFVQKTCQVRLDKKIPWKESK